MPFVASYVVASALSLVSCSYLVFTVCCCRPDEGRTEEELADELPLDKDKDNEESEMIYGEDGKLHPRNEKHEEKPAEEQPGEAQAA